jgi:hypothetical protein
MKTLKSVVLALLFLVLATTATRAASGNINGWWIFEFGMTSEEAASALKEKEHLVKRWFKAEGSDTIVLTMVIDSESWESSIRFDNNKMYEAFLMKGGSMRTNVSAPSYDAEEKLLEQRTKYIERLTKKHGPPDFSDQERKTFDYDPGLVLLRTFNTWQFNAAVIKLICDVLYDNKRGPKNIWDPTISIIYKRIDPSAPKL